VAQFKSFRLWTWGVTSLHGILWAIDSNVNGVLSVFGDTTVSGLTSTGSLSVSGTSTLNGYVKLGNELYVEGKATIHGDISGGSDLEILGDSSLFGFLFVEDDACVLQNLNVHGLTSLGGDLHVYNSSTFDGPVLINNELFVTENTTLHETTIRGDLLVTGILSILNGTKIFSDVSIAGDVSIGGHLSVEHDVTVMKDFYVTHDSSLGGRVAIPNGPLSFPYPYFNWHTGDAQNLTDASCVPLENSTVPCLDYVIVFAVTGQAPAFAAGDFFALKLKGKTFAQLEPGLELPYVYRIETSWTNGEGQTGNYEVGDIIILKGPSDLSKLIGFWDFEDLVNIIGPNPDGNLYNNRDLVSVTLNLFIEHLYSDSLFMYMYSPRYEIGLLPDVQIQSSSVDWVKLN